MADMIVSSLHTPGAEQDSAGIADVQGQAAAPVAVEACHAVNTDDAGEQAAAVELDSGEGDVPATPIKPGAPVVPTGPGGRRVPVEDELDELIIEDFTIDGICGVY
jgi:mycofactocin precursor